MTAAFQSGMYNCRFPCPNFLDSAEVPGNDMCDDERIALEHRFPIEQ